MGRLHKEQSLPVSSNNLLASRLAILARAIGFGRETAPTDSSVVSLSDYSCYQFRIFIEKVMDGLEFLQDQQDADLEYLELFTHVCKLHNSSAEDTAKTFREVFNRGSLTQLLRHPDLWMPSALDYERSISKDNEINFKSAVHLRVKLCRLMRDNRRCILGTMNNQRDAMMLLFYTGADKRDDYVEYLEVAFKMTAIKDSDLDK
jgi:hypothetical protein